MSAAEALQAAQNAGVEIGIDGDDLVLEASAPPPAAVLNLLSRHKAEVLAVLAATARKNKLLAPTPLSERGEQPAEGEPGHEHPRARGAAGCKNRTVCFCTSASSAAGLALTAMASVFALASWAAGIAASIGHKN